MRGPPVIGPLRGAERRAAVALLARAFRDNPLNCAVIGSEDPRRRERSNAHAMRSLLPVAIQHGEVLSAREDAALLGVLIAAPPHAYPLPAPPLLTRLRCVLGQGRRVTRRWSAVFRALDRHHPVEPHFYLGTLGVEPDRQRRGVGRALLARWLEGVDAGGAPAWLETDREANVPFYARAGFQVAGSTEIFGAPVWLMRRAPRAAPSQ